MQGLNKFDSPVKSNDISVSQQAVDFVNANTTLSWIDGLIFRSIKEGGETAASLATQDLDYLFKLNEYLSIQQFFEADINRQIERQSKKPR